MIQHIPQFRRTAFASVFLLTITAAVKIDPSIWPEPASGRVSPTESWVAVSSEFTIIGTGSTTPKDSILGRAMTRYQTAIISLLADVTIETTNSSTVDDFSFVGNLASLTVDVPSTGIVPLSFPMNESYKLSVHMSPGNSSVNAVLTAPTQFGALRGLETVLQLCEAAVVAGVSAAVPVPLEINDYPRFGWRGIMMDTARHFYSVSFIKKTMDVMVANKMSVLHLHLTDDQSFPLQSDAVPELANAGAFYPTQIYSAADVAALVAYGADRGIHVVPELDMPAHTAAWGVGRPDIMVTGEGCSSQPLNHGDVMNPSVPATFEVLDRLLSEQSERFGGTFFHLGGDEVPTTCWTNNASVQSWMKKQHLTTPEEVESYFVNEVAKGPRFSKHNQNLVYWQEIFQNNVTLHPSTVIQAWKTDVMPAVMAAGFRVTNSYGWYLNHGCNDYGDGNWDKFYENEPDMLAPGVTPEQRKLLLGGEVTMWSECVDEYIFEAIVWLRTSAAAEKMWSPKVATESADLPTGTRLALHRCRLLRRGVSVEPPNDSSGNVKAFNPKC